MSDGAIPLSEAVSLARAVQQQGGQVVSINGCFDLLHAGHVDTLSAARALGDCLILLLNSDRSIRRYKGPGRPFISQDHRAQLLRALRAVDAVVIFDEDTPLAALAALQPNLHVKGGSFEQARVSEEQALLESWGGRLHFLPLQDGLSSSALIARIQAGIPIDIAADPH